MNAEQNPKSIRELTDILTWSVLLSKWTAFAQSALSLPDTEEGERWKRSVTPMIGLQALTYALGDSASLSTNERLFGIDRAGVSIRRHAKELDEIWRGEPMPDELIELLDDAGRALAAAAHIAFHWRAASDGFVMPSIDALVDELLEAGYEGELFACAPGTILGEGEPAMVSRPFEIEVDLPGCASDTSATAQQQIYRSIDEGTKTVRDTIVPFHAQMPAGRPLLDHVIASGDRMRELSETVDVERWIEQQARVFEGRAHEIVFAGEDDEIETATPGA